MAEIRPFRGVRYNQQVIQDLSEVVCPPYDIISPQLQDELYRCNPYNFVRVEYNRESLQDNVIDNRYTRSAGNIAQWLKQGILQFEVAPSIYFHQHFFHCQGKDYRRNNLIACIKLEEWETNVIRPHENIIPRAKSDRLKMLEACQANTSPVLAMFEDPQKVISNDLKAIEVDSPGIDVVDQWGDRHKVWSIVRPDVISRIQGVIAEQPLYIADGHHRYDSALTYRREKAARSTLYTGEEGYNFVMTSLIGFTDPGLVVLPSHRLLKGISGAALGGLKAQLKTIFDIEELMLDLPDIWQRLDLSLSGIKPDTKNVKLAVFGLEVDRLLILTLRNATSVDELMPTTHGDLYKRLDVSLVDHVILDKFLAVDADKGELAYNHDRSETINLVKNHQYQLAFLLNPVKPELIRAIADAGDRMPRKSTYFYPKAPAGLVFYKW